MKTFRTPEWARSGDSSRFRFVGKKLIATCVILRLGGELDVTKYKSVFLFISILSLIQNRFSTVLCFIHLYSLIDPESISNSFVGCFFFFCKKGSCGCCSHRSKLLNYELLTLAQFVCDCRSGKKVLLNSNE